MRTQVAIIGAGPAGLFLSHLLHRLDIDCVILEARSREYVEGRVRAGVLERGTVETMGALGLDARMKREGMIDDGLDIRFRGKTIHLKLSELAGNTVTIYGQQEVVKDLIEARLTSGQPLQFEAEVTAIGRKSNIAAAEASGSWKRISSLAATDITASAVQACPLARLRPTRTLTISPGSVCCRAHRPSRI